MWKGSSVQKCCVGGLRARLRALPALHSPCAASTSRFWGLSRRGDSDYGGGARASSTRCSHCTHYLPRGQLCHSPFLVDALLLGALHPVRHSLTHSLAQLTNSLNLVPIPFRPSPAPGPHTARGDEGRIADVMWSMGNGDGVMSTSRAPRPLSVKVAPARSGPREGIGIFCV